MDNSLYIPSPLKPKATIGIIAPAGALPKDDAFYAGIKILKEMGFTPKFPRDLWPGDTFLADSDKNRTKEFHAMWTDPEVDAVMAARGGYGCLRILPHLSPQILSAHKKLFIGFSDITGIHSLLNSQCNLASLHGPVVTSLPQLTEDSLKQFHSMLTLGLANFQFRNTIEVLRQEESTEAITAGGNLSTIVSLLGTRYQPDWSNKIVFLEDVGEQTYKVDKMLTQLFLAGMLTNVKAIVLGNFSEGLYLDNNNALRHHNLIWQRVLDLTDESTTVWANFPIGHGHRSYSFPLGIKIKLCRDSATMKKAEHT